jgi:hypothetical protein
MRREAINDIAIASYSIEHRGLKKTQSDDRLIEKRKNTASAIASSSQSKSRLDQNNNHIALSD